MRILYSHRIQSHDGQGVHLEAMVGAFRAAGHEVLVVGPGLYDSASLGGESWLVALLRRVLPGFMIELLELAYTVPAYLRLRRAARGFRPDIIYERANLFFLAGAWLARRQGLPLILEVNAPLAEERARHGALRLGALARACEHRSWHAADRVLPVTEALAARIEAAGVPRERITVIPNGIHIEDFPAPAEAPPASPDAAVRLGFVGFVRDWHGLDRVVRLIAAPQDGPPLELVVVGDGPARPGLERLATELGVADRIRFTGLAAREAVPGLIAGFDIALQPASVDYASPLKVFEYMAAGRAILAPDQPNLREVLAHERTALLFDPGDPHSFADALRRLVADAGLRRRLGDAARAEILRRDLTWSGNARRVAALAEAEIARRQLAATLPATAQGARQ
jgi:glycosyltransferase involved in cell wall biosynthesis